MNLYKRLYLLLFNSISDALDELHSGYTENAASILKNAQITAEDIYISTGLPSDDAAQNPHEAKPLSRAWNTEKK